MKIRLHQKECDNGGLTCNDCLWYEEGGNSVGLISGCTHPILYDENGDIIKEVEDLILKCLDDPKHCILLQKQNR